MTVETNPNYWDCECENNYIHAKAQTLACSLCGMTEDESPDSRVNEIKETKDVRNNVLFKMDILISDELNQCMACDYTSYEYGEVYDKNGDEITSWNTEDHVVCPNCKSFDYYILKENENE